MGVGAVGSGLGCGMRGGDDCLAVVVAVVAETQVATIEHDRPRAKWYGMWIGIGVREGSH